MRFFIFSLLLFTFSLNATALTDAIEENDIDAVRNLIKLKANLETKGEYGRTPLFYAVKSENLEILNLLINGGAKVDARDNFGETPLIYAVGDCVGEKSSIEAVRILIKAKADLNAKSKYTGSALLKATSCESSSEIVSVLIEAGANINITDAEGRTPLMNAVIFNDLETVRHLLIGKPNLSIRDKKKLSALDHARENASPEIIELLMEVGAK